MPDVLYVDEFQKAAALLQPLRLELLKRMAEPCTCTALADGLGETPQKIYYYVKVLEKAGIVQKIQERRVRGTVEGIYRAKARSYRLSPQLVGRVGGRERAQDRMSLDFLLTLAEELQEDVERLAHYQKENEPLPSLGLSAEILLKDANERSVFAQELQDMFQALARKYGGAKTTVEFFLESRGQNTQLTVLQKVLPPWQVGQFSFSDFWDISLENLRAWVERKTVGARCDFSRSKRGEVRVSVDINASAPAVFDTLINPEQLKRYIAEEPIVEPRIDGRYSFGWKDGGPLKILDIVPNKKLSYSWHYRHGSHQEPETVVTWSLEGSGDKTRLVLVHSGFALDRECSDYDTGWLGFLNRIKSLVESQGAWAKPNYLATDYASVA